MPKPSRSSTIRAARSESGIAVSEMAAAPASERKTTSTTATSTAPSSSEVTMFRSARSMNSDGRKMSGWSVRPAARMAGSSRASAASARWATTLVLAPSCAEIDDDEPAPAVHRRLRRTAAPAPRRRGRDPPGAARSRRARAPRSRPSASAVAAWPSARTVMRWFAPSITPAPRTPVASRAAAATSATPSRRRRRRSGSSWIWSWRTSPPNTATLETPGVASSRGRTTQSTKVRCSISDRVSEVTPTTSTVLEDDVSGVSTGRLDRCGERGPPPRPAAPPSAWRAR